MAATGRSTECLIANTRKQVPGIFSRPSVFQVVSVSCLDPASRPGGEHCRGWDPSWSLFGSALIPKKIVPCLSLILSECHVWLQTLLLGQFNEGDSKFKEVSVWTGDSGHIYEEGCEEREKASTSTFCSSGLACNWNLWFFRQIVIFHHISSHFVPCLPVSFSFLICVYRVYNSSSFHLFSEAEETVTGGSVTSPAIQPVGDVFNGRNANFRIRDRIQRKWIRKRKRKAKKLQRPDSWHFNGFEAS